MGRRLTLDEFIKRANEVHHHIYDYSQAEYHNGATKVKIICPDHGVFWQTPACHINAKQGCPECAKQKRKDTCKQRYGTELMILTAESRKKSRETARLKYGGDTCFSSSQIQCKIRQTIRDRYGVDNPQQNPNVREKTKQTNLERYGCISTTSVPEIKKKQCETNIKRYGVPNSLMSNEIRAKGVATWLDKYGCDNPMKNDIIKAKTQKTVLDRYGVKYVSQNPVVINKILTTKRKRHTFNTSVAESIIYNRLCDVFGKDDVFTQYKSDVYPFACDFYIKSRDMYIELNLFCSHGDHWFDCQSNDDIECLNKWKQKLILQNSEFYRNVINNWTKRDPLKRETARLHNLNYVVFWDKDLKDADLWFNQNCPDRHDWE